MTKSSKPRITKLDHGNICFCGGVKSILTEVSVESDRWKRMRSTRCSRERGPWKEASPFASNIATTFEAIWVIWKAAEDNGDLVANQKRVLITQYKNQHGLITLNGTYWCSS